MLTRIKVDDAAVELVREQGFAMDDVRPTGQMVKLALTGNMSTGGISIDRTFEAHPDNVEIAEEAARVVGLDIAGIDFICPDITEPVRETGGAICEVNAAPGFRMHTHPTIGEPQYIAKPVIDLLFPPGTTDADPDRGRHRHERQDDHVADDRPHLQGHGPQGRHDLHRRGRHRRAAGDPGRRVRPELGADGAAEPARRLRGARGRARRHPARGPRLRPQRRRRRPQRQPDHLGLRGIDTVEHLADVKAVLVEAVPRDGHAVLNADDPLVARHGPALPGEVVWFSMEEPGSEPAT